MRIRFRKGSMPQGGTYEEFAELLAALYKTFEPLKGRGGEDAEAFAALKGLLDGLAERHQVAPPETVLSEAGGLTACATPFDVLETLTAIVRDFGLCGRLGDPDDRDRGALGRIFLGVLHRQGAIEAAFDTDGAGRRVAVGVKRWLEPDDTPMGLILDPHRKERNAT